MNWSDRRTDVWTMKLWKVTLVTPRGKKENGTHEFGPVKETLMEPRSQPQILVIRISNGTIRHPNLSVMDAVMLDATFCPRSATALACYVFPDRRFGEVERGGRSGTQHDSSVTFSRTCVLNLNTTLGDSRAAKFKHFSSFVRA